MPPPPAPLKLPHFPPFKLHLPSTTTTVTSSSSSSAAVVASPKSLAGWRWRNFACFSSGPLHHQFRSPSFRIPQIPSLSTFNSFGAVRDCRFHCRNHQFRSQMGAAVDGKPDAPCNGSQPLPPGRDKPPPPKLLNLPTILTIGRVAAVPLLVGTFYVESWWGPSTTTGIFILAAITDWLDGYLARKMKLGTQFGAFLDPVADKLMVAATLILLCTRPVEVGMLGQVPWMYTVPAIAIIGREITMSAVREWAASQDKKLLEAVAVNNLGKWKTATQMSALTILLAARDGSLIGAGSMVSSGLILLYISAWLSLWSLMVYMRKIWKVLIR